MQSDKVELPFTASNFTALSQGRASADSNTKSIVDYTTGSECFRNGNIS
jgi:hypothetical protein